MERRSLRNSFFSLINMVCFILILTKGLIFSEEHNNRGGGQQTLELRPLAKEAMRPSDTHASTLRTTTDLERPLMVLQEGSCVRKICFVRLLLLSGFFGFV